MGSLVCGVPCAAMHCSGKPEKLLLIAAVYMRLDQGLCIKNGCPRHEQQTAVPAGLEAKGKKPKKRGPRK